MILHIVKRDIRILWLYIVGAALIDLADAILRLAIESVQFRGDYQVLNAFILAADFITIVFGFALVAMDVQLDAIPGDRQDWLARPIRRRDLLSAKLLFVVLFVQVPLLLADTVHGMGVGFPLGQTLAAAGLRNLYIFILMTLPAMALAAMTTSVKQSLGLGLAVSVGAIVFAGGILGLYNLIKLVPDNANTMSSFVLQMAVLLVAATIVLGMQYFLRATVRARVVIALGAILALAARLLLPQDAAYAMENWFSSGPGQNTSLVFAPVAGRLRTAGSGSAVASPGNLTDQGRLIALPLMVAGLPPQLTLVGENLRALVTAPNGDSLELQAQNFPLHTQGRDGKIYYQMLRVPAGFFQAYEDQPMRVELSYNLAVVRPRGTYEMGAAGRELAHPQRAYSVGAGGELNVPELGRCATSIGPFGNDVILRCMQVGEEHMHVTAALTDRAKGLSNPERTLYWPSDAPYRNTDAILTRFGSALPFQIANAAARFPVGPEQMPEATVRLNLSQPLTWILRRVSIANVRLNAWTPKLEPAP